ncbi:MAG: T9SS type A sorting domain-containing protein [Bacteroidetes bacterium]|nr:T9SS type A sorting domain-containing protein [Bacteroidota bacterium]
MFPLYFLIAINVITCLPAKAQCIAIGDSSGTVQDTSMTNSVNFNVTISPTCYYANLGAFVGVCTIPFPGIVAPFSGNTNGSTSAITYTFSSALTSVDLLIGYTGVNGTIATETFLFTTNSVTPTIAVNSGTCIPWTIVGNQTTSPSIVGGLNSIHTISSATPFSEFSIFTNSSGTGPGANGGSSFALCNGGLILTQSVALGNDTTLCAGQNLTLNAGISNATYLWQDSTTNPVYTVTQAGTYWVQVSNSLGITTDTINVFYNVAPTINLGNDTSICAGDTLTLNAGAGYTSYLWQDASTDSIFTATVGGVYYVTVANGNCFTTDTILLSVSICNTPLVNLSSSDTIFCEKQCIDFTDLSTNNPTSWQWNFAGASPSTSTDQNPAGICYNNYGSFDVTLIACNSAGCDTLLLTGFINEYQIPAPTITQSGDTLFSSLAVSYQWYSVDSGLIIGAVNYNYIPTYIGSFYVIVTDTIGCEGASNTIMITGVNDFYTSNFLMEIIPNPFSDVVSLNLHFINSNYKRVVVEIKNFLGQAVYVSEIIKERNVYSKTIDLSFLNEGIYLVEVKVDDNRFVKKIVKQ